jgi:ABC-type branched-subunit amino acid transport system ATPase component
VTLLETKGLSINFGELWAVNNIDFQIAENETIGLIGPNGSGKTTFFNLISMIYKPTKGSIFLQGRGCYQPVASSGPGKRHIQNISEQQASLESLSSR